MAKNKRLGKPFDEVYAEACERDPGLNDRVEAIREERWLQAKLCESRKAASAVRYAPPLPI